jgi:enoyl-[acyl-carrier protein] reductase II
MGPDAFRGIQEVYFGGDMNAAPALAGQSAGLVHAVLTAQQIIDQTVAEFHQISQRLGQLAQRRSFD